MWEGSLSVHHSHLNSLKILQSCYSNSLQFGLLYVVFEPYKNTSAPFRSCSPEWPKHWLKLVLWLMCLWDTSVSSSVLICTLGWKKCKAITFFRWDLVCQLRQVLPSWASRRFCLEVSLVLCKQPANTKTWTNAQQLSSLNGFEKC